MARLLFCARPLTCFWPEESGTGVSLVCQVQSLLNKVCPENLALIVEKIAAVEACDVGSSCFFNGVSRELFPPIESVNAVG